MGRYVARRLLLAIPVVIGASFLIFAMVYARSGPWAETARSRQAWSPSCGTITTSTTRWSCST
jgi:oligopeptide transport system permease protein